MKSLLQTQEWVNFKVSQGWKSHHIEGVFVLEKPLPWGKSFLYAPEVEYKTITNLQIFLQKLQEIAEISHSIFFRLEILDEKRSEIIENLKKRGFIKAFEELQPEWRQMIDIGKSEEEILAQMKPKGRYNIRVAERHGCKAEIVNPQSETNSQSPAANSKNNLDIFYDLYCQTAKYQKISRRPKRYFEEMLKKLPAQKIAIIIVKYQNQPLAALLVTFYDKVASYLYGGTSRENKQVMAPYAAHWAAIREAKKRGCQIYDLLAVAPPDQPNHKYRNLTFFKEQFGGRKVNLVGSWDYIYKPIWYKIFKATEKFRRK